MGEWEKHKKDMQKALVPPKPQQDKGKGKKNKKWTAGFSIICCHPSQRKKSMSEVLESMGWGQSSMNEGLYLGAGYYFALVIIVVICYHSYAFPKSEPDHNGQSEVPGGGKGQDFDLVCIGFFCHLPTSPFQA